MPFSEDDYEMRISDSDRGATVEASTELHLLYVVNKPAPPRKKLRPGPKTIVHPAPSHDGIPAFVAYSVPGDTPGNADLTPMRPAWAYVFYDTSPGALNPGRAENLARSIFNGTENSRSSDELPERIDVFAMPLPPLSETGSPYSAEELGLDLVLLQESPRPVTSLLSTGLRMNPKTRPGLLAGRTHSPGHTISQTSNDARIYTWRRELQVNWRLRDENEDDEAPPLAWLKVAFEMLGESALISNRYWVHTLYEHFIPDGVFDFEREKARERGADDGVDLPMQTR
ncbi:hypothetical protein CSAL01_12342 [Colletotrichum salicis]|uniref:Uncharacterized protein n=1 Tax=Colletotrichum salicis TaxID=1209931 RepID=A0A135UQP6_9PEZI|nr:hypothetical protein CSAL01_12342 [Colletotrichum salicis]